MAVYRALKDRRVGTPSGPIIVLKGTAVEFDEDPGEGWEEVKRGSDSGSKKRTVDSKRSRVSVHD